MYYSNEGLEYNKNIDNIDKVLLYTKFDREYDFSGTICNYRHLANFFTKYDRDRLLHHKDDKLYNMILMLKHT